MKVKYKFKRIRLKYFIQSIKFIQIWQKTVERNITKNFKSKQQKSFISLNTLTTLFIFQKFSTLSYSIFFLTIPPLLLILIVHWSTESNDKPYKVLHEKCPYLEFSWSVFPGNWTKYGEVPRIPPYLGRMRENTDQKNSEYGHFSHNE